MAHKGVPHNPILNYTSGAMSSTASSVLGVVNLPRDLSAVNRQHWEHTTPRGVPLVYRVAVTISPTLADGSDANSYLELFTGDTDLLQKVKVLTCQNNWVVRNAAVKTHAARENMFKKQGVRKGERGAYDKTIHYTWDGTPGSFLTPFDGDGNAFTGADSGSSGFQSDWEYSKLIYSGDAGGAFINLIDAHTTEETQETFAALCLPQLYLQSRKQVEDDTNTDDDDQPAQYSVLRKLLSPMARVDISEEIVDLARDNQDTPPYDLNFDGDWTEPVLSASAFIGMSTTLQATMVVDIPFGLFELKGNNLYIDAGQNLTNAVEIRCEVIDIIPMGEY